MTEQPEQIKYNPKSVEGISSWVIYENGIYGFVKSMVEGLNIPPRIAIMIIQISMRDNITEWEKDFIKENDLYSVVSEIQDLVDSEDFSGFDDLEIRNYLINALLVLELNENYFRRKTH